MIEKTTRHCPNCDGEHILYEMNPFTIDYTKRYNGNCQCSECGCHFDVHDLIEKVWLLKTEIRQIVEKHLDKKCPALEAECKVNNGDTCIPAILDEIGGE